MNPTRQRDKQGGGSYYARRPWNRRRQPSQVTKCPPPPLGDIIAKVYLNELDTLVDDKADVHPAKITDVEQFGSYNWLKEGAPTILIPGKPPRWTPLLTPIKLKEDSGTYYRDRNAAHFPGHPMQPAVEAILSHQHDDPINASRDNIDLVACNSTMYNLLRFVSGQENPFRMLVEVIGSTVFFVRRENSPTECIPDLRGHGHTFPEAYTSWGPDVKGSQSHYRMLRYGFGGLDCVVRFEPDGYLPSLVSNANGDKPRGSEEASSHTTEGAILALQETTIGIGRVSELFESNPSPKPQIQRDKTATVIPQSAVFDLKTRWIKKRDINILSQEMPRLWIAQIPNFILAYHEWGVFQDIQVQDVRDDVAQWEETNERQLRLFAMLLRKLVSFARSQVSAKLEICRQEGDSNIEIREQCEDAGDTLPEEVAKRWVSRFEAMGEEYREDTDEDGDEDGGTTLEWEEKSEDDFTACSASSCGYCGQCKY